MAEHYPLVLADLDVEEPNSGLFLAGELLNQVELFKAVPSWEKNACNLCGLCPQFCAYNAIVKLGWQILIFPELCHSCHACSELCPQQALPLQQQKLGDLLHYKLPNLEFVESKLMIGQEQAVPLIAQTLGYLDQRFGTGHLIICDSPPGTSCPVIKATQDASLVLLVTEPTPFGYHDLCLAVETMRVINRPFAVVINKHGIGDDKVESYCQKEGIGIIARFPNDRRIAELYSAGKLIYPQHRIFKEQLALVRDYILRMAGDRG